MSQWTFTLAEEMGDDEVFAGIVAAAIALFGLARWLAPAMLVHRVGGHAGRRLLIMLTPALCLGVMLPALLTIAAVEVREDMRYVILFLIIGAAWLTAMQMVMPLLGVSVRDDALERRNTAAVIVITAAMFAITIVYIGGNTGEGPTIWTTIGPALLASVTFVGLWGLVESFTHVSEQVTVDRDIAAAVRHSGFLLAMGLVLGRAVAGDWESSGATLDDFAEIGWPAAALAAIAVPLHWLGRPTPAAPRRSVAGMGILPALLFLGLAAAWLRYLGHW